MNFIADTQSRKYQLTINAPEKKELNHEQIKLTLAQLKSVIYYCMADEIGLETKLYHTHIFIVAKSPIKFSRIKKLFPEAHIEQANGTSQQNRDYIRKDGKWADDEKADTSIVDTFEEWGEIPEEQQGHRTDLDVLYQMVKDGKSDFEILETNPEYMLRLQAIEKVRQTLRYQENRTTFRNLDITYIFGATGTGKTRSTLEKYGYEGCYRATDYTHPFDAYAGQDVLILDEFRSDLKIGEMLNFLDGYPLELPCRYANKVACYTKVYIISNISLEEQYPSIQLEHPSTWQAFLRRIHNVSYFFKDSFGNNQSYSIPIKQYKNSENLKQIAMNSITATQFTLDDFEEIDGDLPPEFLN